MIGLFFVILYLPNGRYTYLVNEYDDLAIYETRNDARIAANSTILGSELGYEIFEIGTGDN